jgi:archaellum component FlaC
MKRARFLGLMIGLLFLSHTLLAQEAETPVPTDVAELKAEIELRLSQFSDELNQMLVVGQMNFSVDGSVGVSQSVVNAMAERLKSLNQSYNALDVKWNTYYQAQQMDIANDEELMNKVAGLEALKQTVKDTLDSKTLSVESIIKFADADKFIISQVAVYKNLYQKAYKLSLLKKLAPQLEKVKAKEQLVFTELQTHYDQAKASCEVVPVLSKRMTVLDEQYVVMKSVSEKVQALEYKPFFQRVKDYVLGFAAVAIILMFFNMSMAKFKAYRDKVNNLGKYKKMLDNQGKGTNYPTI